jgi:hypothetical protein
MTLANSPLIGLCCFNLIWRMNAIESNFNALMIRTEAGVRVYKSLEAVAAVVS